MRANADHILQGWNFSHIVDSLNGKHITIKKTANSDFNMWKRGKKVAAQMLGFSTGQSDLLYGLETNCCNLPPDEGFPYDTITTLHNIVSDGAFSLRPWMMKPFPGRNLFRN